MRTISQRELRNHSGEVLRAVAAGESILITNNSQPAALLTPVPTTTRERLLTAGRLVPAEQRFDAPRPQRRPVRTTVNELLEHDRSGDR